MVNHVKQEPFVPNATASSSTLSAPKFSASSSVVRRTFQFGSAPLGPTSPTSPTSSHVQMVVFQELDGSDSHWSPVSNVCTVTDDRDWVILDSGSDVSLLPSRCQPYVDDDKTLGSLHTCQGGTLQTAGTRKAELVTVTEDDEELLLQREFIVGNVTSCLVSLGQLCQGGWTILKNDNNGDLSLKSPGEEIKIPIKYRNKSFAIKAHVLQIVEASSSTTMAGGDAVALGPDGVDDAPMDSLEMTSDRTPYLKSITRIMLIQVACGASIGPTEQR